MNSSEVEEQFSDMKIQNSSMSKMMDVDPGYDHGEVEKTTNTNLTFDPPVYLQRYSTVVALLGNETWKHQIFKVVDFGCGELKLFKYLKHVPNITHVYAVDVEENLILENLREVKPRTFEYISGFSKRLTVDLFAGSIADSDERLADVDAVICIELIEHLYDEVLEKVPTTVFKYMKPKLAIFTTPNADFNVLFNLKKFRHDDHKFEWTRAEFQNWCSKITTNYPNYDVSFDGIGRGPPGTECFGCCSQMAIFSKKKARCNTSPTELMIGTPYKLLSTVTYPCFEDTRNDDQKFLDEVNYRIGDVITSQMGQELQSLDLKYRIPVSYLGIFLTTWCSSEEMLLNRLVSAGFVIEKNCDNQFALIYDPPESSESSEEEIDLPKNMVPVVGTVEECWD